MMVAIFTGAGTGFERGSGGVLGSSGLLGSAGLGRGGEQVFLNAANGNLLISRQDEFLVGRGPDASVGRTYNSLGNHGDDNGDNWLQSTDRRVFGLTGAANSWGSTVKRRSADGSEIGYGWDGTSYVATDGAGSFDRLRYNGSSWTWTDGDSRVTETYSAFADHWRIASQSDTSGNALTYGYTGDKLTTLTTANGEALTYVWSGDHISEVISGDGASTVYAYDGHGRLSRVTVALSPGGGAYSTWYSYVGATTLVSRIEQSDGSILDIGYDAVDRVTSLVQTVASGVTRTTGIAYGVGHAIVTDPAGQATRLDYAPGNLVPDIATWPRSNLTAVPATIDGGAATRFEVTDAGLAAIKWALTAAPGDTLSYAVTLQGSGDSTAASIGLYGTLSGWGDNGWALARIVSGPGTLSREAGGLFNITGLSTTTPTRIEITRSYDRAETGGIDIYVDRPLGMRAGRSLLIGAVALTPGIAAERANQLTGITSGYGTDQARTVRFGYNTNGDLTGVTDSMGQATAYTYDANGNLLTTTDRLGTVVTRTYDAANQLLTETRIGSDKDGAAAAHTIRHVHDGANRLRFTIDAEGGVTEYDYGADGLLRLTQQYRGRFDLSGLGTASAPSEAQMVAWTGTVEPTEIMITELRYDVRGNLTQKLRYGGAYAPGSPHEADGCTQEYYTYDLAGRLLSSFVAGRNRETYVYDGLGRLTAKTDVNEGTTSFVFNDAATQTIVTLANGFVQTSTYDKTGALVGFTESGAFVESGTARYAYDRNGRLRTTTDATGRKVHYLYDGLGRKVADIDGNGSVTEYRYDGNGRLVGTAHYAGAVTGGGTLAALDDPDNSLALAAIRPLAHPDDLWTWSVYDREGRLIAAIAGDGSVTAYEYDGSGRLVKTIGHVNKLSAGQIEAFKANGPSASRPDAHPADSIARLFYDRAGRTIGALDGEGYLTRTIYDGAGQKVQEIAYANATAAAQRAGGSLQALIDSAGTSASDRSVRHVYDQQGLLRFSIDALNQVTGYVYVFQGWPWSAFGPVRQTIEYAGTLPALSRYTHASVKNAVAALAGDPANRATSAIYDYAGRLAYTIGATGAVVGHVYDNMGRLVRKIEYATANATTTLYSKAEWDDWAAHYATSSDRVTRYYHNARGELRFVIDAEGYVTRTDYDAAGRVSATRRWDVAVSANDSWTIAAVDNAAGGNWAGTSTYYDAAGRVTRTINQAGQSRRYYYHANGLLAWDIASEGGQDDSRTYYLYDAAGRKAVEYAAFGTAEQAITTYRYNGLGDLVETTGSNAGTTSFAYDRAGRVIRRTNAYGSPTVFEHNAFGEVTRTINARGFSTYSQYDQAGRVTLVVDALGYTTSTSYTVFGEVASVTRGGAVTRFGYDKLGRLVTSTDAEGGVETSGYDAFGNRTRFRNKLGGVTEYSYDRRGLLAEERVQAILDGSGNVVTAGFSRNRYEYDARGNVVHRVEAYDLAERRDTWFAYDKADRLTSKWGAAVAVGLAQTLATPTENYRYDTRGNLIETIDAAGARAFTYYDDLDRRIATVVQAGSAGNPQGVLSTFEYDAGGNLVARRTHATPIALPGTAGGTPPVPADGSFRETRYGYDALDRLVWTRVAEQSVGHWNGAAYVHAPRATLETTYEYNVVGDLVRTTDGTGKSLYSYYDDAGRKIAQVDQQGYLTRWTLDAEGNVLSERRFASPAGGATSSGYAEPTPGADDRVTEFAYDRMGRRTEERRLNVEAWGLNLANGQLLGASGTSLIRYTYNLLGQVLTKTEATGDRTTYTYDDAGRLVREARSAFGGVTPTLRYSYDRLGQLVMTRQGDDQVSGSDRITSNRYDGAGRLVGVTDALGQTRSYVYDVAGRKIGEYYNRALGDAAGTMVVEGISYQYDLADNLVRRAVNAISGGVWNEVSWTQSAYNAFGEVTARGTNGGWQEQFVYDNGGRLVRSNAGDGVWRIHAYDAAGRQTLTIESDGNTDLSGMSQAEAIGRIAGGTVTATATRFDGRGQAVETVQMLRRTAVGGAAQNIATARGYTAFGELAWEDDAHGRRTDYGYNNMGRVLQIRRPMVSVTAENGTVSSIRPTENFFYDISGRLIGTQDANSVWTGSGVKTTRQLLAGTGYGDAAALVVREWHADGEAASGSYDVFGDRIGAWDELGRYTAMVYDQLGRLTQATRPATAAGALVQSYAYDVLGQRIGQWNNVVGYAARERTEYDALGRVTLQVAFGGDATTTSYAWDAGIVAWGMETPGGWIQTTSTDADRASSSDGIHAAIQYVDIFGRVASRTDKGGQAYAYRYDRAGRIVAETSTLSGLAMRNLAYGYYNTGQIRQVVSGDAPAADSNWDRKVASYDYDALGQLTRETLVRETGEYRAGGYYPVPGRGPILTVSEGDGQDEWEWVPPSYTVQAQTLQDGRAEYDAAGRITRYRDTLSSGVDAVDKSWSYDAAGNVRSIVTDYLPVQADGVLSGTATRQSWWYRYDSMSRLVTTKGMLVGAPGSGVIARGDAGTDLGYDATGARVRAQTGAGAEEVYSYDAAGQLATVVIGGTTRARTDYDLLGRVTSHVEYDGWGMAVHSRHDIVYDARGLVLAEKGSTRQGGDWLQSHTVNYYSATGTGAPGPAIGWAGQAGSASGSLLYYSETKNWKNGGTPVYGGPGSYSRADLDYADSYTSQSYAWRDGAVQAQVQLVNRDGTSSSSYGHDRDGALRQVRIEGGSRPRTISYRSDLQGQLLYRAESDGNPSTAEPLTRTYRFGGRQMGLVSNDGTSNLDYAGAIDARTAAPGSGAFRGGAGSGTVFADFDANFTALNGGETGGASRYVASAGETLQSIAAQLWGDANLWYKLAEANPGLSAGGALGGGTALTVPGGVVGNRHDATTFRPYDPAEAIGNTSPNTPNPPQKGNRCGTLGAIVMVAIAVAVTMLTRVPFAKLFAGMGMGSAVGAGGAVLAGTTSIGLTSTAAIAGGVAAGVAGSVASQAFGVAARLQDGISWKGVALAGISAGVSGGLAGSFERIAGSAFLGDVVRGALGSVVSQGIGVATRLQDKFDFAGVAAAGLGSGASGAIGLGGFEGRLVGNTVGGIANAAARSLLGGTDFGDNILAALPDIIGQTVGEVIAGNWKPSAIERAFLNDAEASIARARAADSDLIPFPADAFTSGGVQLVDIPASSSYSLPSSIANESLNLAETPIAAAATLREVGTKNSSRISERDDYIDPYGAFEGALESPDGNSLVYFASRSGTSSQYKLDMAEAIGLEYGALSEDKAIRVGAHLRDLALRQLFLVEGRDYLRDASVTLAGMVEHLAYGKGWAKVLEVVNAAYIDVSAEVSRRDNQLYTETATLYAEAGRAVFSSVNLAMTAVDYSQGKAGNADMFLAAMPFTRLGKLERFASAPRMSPIFKVPKIRASAAEGTLPPAVDLPNGSLSSASAWTKAARLRNAGSGIGLPSKEGYLRFVPPKNWSPERALPRGPAGGYLDRHGNEWMPDLVKGEWDVQLGRTGRGQLGYLSKNGRYLNVTPDGRISH